MEVGRGTLTYRIGSMPPPHGSLPKDATVSYLVAHAEQLARAGEFNGKLPEYIVFEYLCHHPGETMPGYKSGDDQFNNWLPPVAYPHWQARVIADNTPLHRTTVEKALDWLADKEFIGIDYQQGEKASNKKRGLVTIYSTCEFLEQYRKTPVGYRDEYYRGVRKPKYNLGF
jgi:hypothetical protein